MDPNTKPLDDLAAPSPWSRPGFVGAAAVIGVVLVLLVGLLVSDLFGGDDTPPAVMAEQPAIPEQSEASDSVCGLSDVQMTGTITQPPPATWTLAGTIAVPFAEGTGPGEIFDDQFRRCFAHTPEGALFSAANLTGLGSVSPLEKTTTEWYIASGPGRQAAIDKAGTHSGASGTLRLQIGGFRLLNYTGDTATVDLAYRVSNGTWASQLYDLVWEDGDWRARANADGTNLLTPIAQIPDITGYIPWGGA